MKAVITVVGNDRTGIIASVSNILFQNNVNILDISQKVMEGMFNMVMVVDISDCVVEFSSLVDVMDHEGEKLGMKIHCMHQDIFDAMHKI